MKLHYLILFSLLCLLTVADVSAQMMGQKMKAREVGGSLQATPIRDVDGLTYIGSGSYGSAHLMDVEMAGDRAYVSRGIEGLETWDISVPSNPVRLQGNPPAAWGAKAYGDRLYVFTRNRGFRIYDISGSTPSFIGNYDPFDADTLFENGVLSGTDFYVAAHQRGLFFFDVSNESSPSLQDELSLAESDCWDVEMQGSYLYVANGHHGLSVVDVTTPAEVATLPLPGLANHLEIDGDVVVLTLGCEGIATVDISDPLSPELLDRIPTDGNAFGCGLYNHQVAVGSWTVLELFDISDPRNIKRTGWDNTDTWAEGADIAPFGNDTLIAVADWESLRFYRVGDDPGPDINVSPDRLDFGEVLVSEELKVEVKNTGTTLLTVDLSPTPSGIAVSPMSFSVPAGGSKKISVVASGTGSTFSSIYYNTNDPNESTVRQFVYKNNSSFPQIGSQAPDFTLNDVYGNPHSLSDYLGKVIYLEFGGLW